MTGDEKLIEDIARAICEADSRAPAPDAAILIGMQKAKAWEARIPVAEAALQVVRSHDAGQKDDLLDCG
jgi:hypothetical protein